MCTNVLCCRWIERVRAAHMLKNDRYEWKRVNGGSKAGTVWQNPNDAAHKFSKHIINMYL